MPGLLKTPEPNKNNNENEIENERDISSTEYTRLRAPHHEEKENVDLIVSDQRDLVARYFYLRNDLDDLDQDVLDLQRELRRVQARRENRMFLFDCLDSVDEYTSQQEGTTQNEQNTITEQKWWVEILRSCYGKVS